MDASGKRRAIALMIACLLLVLVFPAVAYGASDMNISDLRLDVWPEYDDGRVMVQYLGEFADKKAIPAKVKFYIPKEAEDIHACAITDDGQHQCNAFERDEQGDLIELSYELAKPKFAVMFYYKDLKSQGDNKQFDFLYKASYPADKITIDLQQPLKASNFKATPSSSNTTTDEKGFKYLLYDYNDVEDGKEIPVSVQYTKTDPNPSVEKGAQTTGGAGSSGSKGGTNPWIILGVVSALVVLPLGGYFLATSRSPAPAGRVSPPAATGRARSGGKGTRFCTNCGAKINASDKFCPNCGGKARG